MWSCFKGINPKLILIKVHFFLFFSGLSCAVPYIPVIAKDFGVSASLIGIVTIAICLIGLVAKPLFGAIADHFHKHKEVLLIVVVASNILYMGIVFLPSPIIPGLVKLPVNVSTQKSPSIVTFFTRKSCLETLNFNESINAFCDTFDTSETFTETFWLQSNSSSTKNLTEYSVLNTTIDDTVSAWAHYRCNVTVHSNNTELCGHADDISPIYNKYQFWLFIFLVLLSRAGTVAVVSLSDTAAFDLLQGNTDDYGKQRLWGGVGWGAMSLVGGALIKMGSHSDDDINYAPGFYLMFAIGILDAITLWFIKLENPSNSGSICKNVGELLRKMEILSFLFLVFIIGALTGLQWNYFYWYINSLGANSLLLGIAMCCQAFLGEVPFFFVSGWIIKKVGSLNALTFTFFSFATRFLIYSYIHNPWSIIPVELLEGVTFSLFYSVITIHAKEIAPPGTEATIQGLVGGTFDGLGVAFGALIGGIGFDQLGGRMTFRYFSVASYVICVLHVITRVAAELSKRRGKAVKQKAENLEMPSVKPVERF